VNLYELVINILRVRCAKVYPVAEFYLEQCASSRTAVAKLFARLQQFEPKSGCAPLTVRCSRSEGAPVKELMKPISIALPLLYRSSFLPSFLPSFIFFVVKMRRTDR
jgi:hypothetical protein